MTGSDKARDSNNETGTAVPGDGNDPVPTSDNGANQFPATREHCHSMEDHAHVASSCGTGAVHAHDSNNPIPTSEHVATQSSHHALGGTCCGTDDHVHDSKGDNTTIIVPGDENDDVPRSSGVSQFQVQGLCCSSEVPLLRELLESKRGALIDNVNVNITTKVVYVRHDPKTLSARDIANDLTRGGFRSCIVKDAGGDEEWRHEGKVSVEGPRLSITVILCGVFWILSMFSYITPEWDNLKYCGVISVIFGVPPIARKAFLTITRCQFDANVMMVIAAIGSLALGEYDEAASVSFLFSVSEYLESKATARARRAMADITNLRRQETATLQLCHGGVKVVPVDEIKVGDVTLIKPGDTIPCDGVVRTGQSVVDESALASQSHPAHKSPSDNVSGGSVNVGDGPLSVSVTVVESESALSRLVRLAEEAQSGRASQTEQIVDLFAKRYTLVVIALSVGMFIMPWLLPDEEGGGTEKWVLNGLIMIVAACPCALAISTPVTYAAGLAACAKWGVIVKDGARLEALGQVQQIVFDKTGTLTTGKFKLCHLNIVDKQRLRSEVLQLLALMEEPSSHPLSKTLVEAAIAENINTQSPNHAVENHTILPGEGITALINSTPTYVGNKDLFERLEMYQNLPPNLKTETEKWSQEGGTVGFLGLQGSGILAAYCVSDSIRDEAHDIVDALRYDMNIGVTMVTGDSDDAAKGVGNRLGLHSSCIEAGLSPEGKLAAMQRIKREPFQGGRDEWNDIYSRIICQRQKSLLLMCGDGVNDAPALARSDVGVAMGSSAAMLREMSDVILMDSSLVKLVDTIKMGRKALLTIKENISLALLSKLAIIVLTFFNMMTLFGAIATDIGTMLLVTYNGMKLLPAKNGGCWSALKTEVISARDQQQYREVRGELV